MRLLLFFCLSLLAMPAIAADKYVLDKTHTSILWFADHLGFSKSVGSFTVFDGMVVLDHDAAEKSNVDVSIALNSVSTGIADFDAHLRGEDFLDAKSHPIAHFRSVKVVPTGADTALVHGDFTLRGITKPLSLQVTMNKIGTHPKSKKEIAGFSATGRIKRSDYGMHYAIPAIPDMVELMIEAEAIQVTNQ